MPAIGSAPEASSNASSTPAALQRVRKVLGRTRSANERSVSAPIACGSSPPSRASAASRGHRWRRIPATRGPAFEWCGRRPSAHCRGTMSGTRARRKSRGRCARLELSRPRNRRDSVSDTNETSGAGNDDRAARAGRHRGHPVRAFTPRRTGRRSPDSRPSARAALARRLGAGKACGCRADTTARDVARRVPRREVDTRFPGATPFRNGHLLRRRDFPRTPYARATGPDGSRVDRRGEGTGRIRRAGHHRTTRGRRRESVGRTARPGLGAPPDIAGTRRRAAGRTARHIRLGAGRARASGRLQMARRGRPSDQRLGCPAVCGRGCSPGSRAQRIRPRMDRRGPGGRICPGLSRPGHRGADRLADGRRARPVDRAGTGPGPARARPAGQHDAPGQLARFASRVGGRPPRGAAGSGAGVARAERPVGALSAYATG